jgi:hypothetical protein
VPRRFTLRTIEFATFADLGRLQGPTFVKPADPLDKWFDAGVYRDPDEIRTTTRVTPDAPVLMSEPVEWSAECRCFVLEGMIVASSPYLSFGRPVWNPHDPNRPGGVIPKMSRVIVERMVAEMRGALPPAFVVDVGLIEDRGWGVVEFNPVWCSGLLGADPRAVLSALRRATVVRSSLSAADRRWDFRRSDDE